MAQFPINTPDGLYEAVNYLASGPQGLGQNFAGFSSYEPAYLTGNYRFPFTSSSEVPLYVAPINLSNAELLDPYTWKFTFASTQATAPFTLGSGVTISGVNPGDPGTLFGNSDFNIDNGGMTYSGTMVTFAADQVFYNIFPTTTSGTGSGAAMDVYLKAGETAYDYTTVSISVNNSWPIGYNYSIGDTLVITGDRLGGTTPANDMTLVVTATESIYDGTYTPIGVASCTTDYVILKTNTPYSGVPAYVSGGTASYSAINQLNSTDCNARVVVTGGTDRVFISAQMNNIISYTATEDSDMDYIVQVNRYVGFLNNDPINPDYLFLFDKTISEKVYSYSALNGDSSLTEVETIFSTVIDQPSPGFYWYILEVENDVTTGDLELTTSEFGLRSLSAQVVKQ